MTCGVFDVVDGAIVLTSDGTATYALHFVEKGTARDLTYSSSGTFRQDGGKLVLAVVGRWSNQAMASQETVVLDVGVGVLHHAGGGAECDAGPAVETYRLNR